MLRQLLNQMTESCHPNRMGVNKRCIIVNYGEIDRSLERPAEYQMLSALLMRAINDVMDKNHIVFGKAIAWICYKGEKHDDKYTFNEVCEYLEVDPIALRERILDLSEWVIEERKKGLAVVIPFDRTPLFNPSFSSLCKKQSNQ